jgi:hypothetical protein
MRSAIAMLIFSSCCHAAVVVDRMAVIVSKHVIKTSDIDRDLRVTEFLNRQPLDFSPEVKRKSAERLIDQEIIRQEIVTGAYRRPSDVEAVAFEKQLLNDRFRGSTAALREALAKNGLTEEQLRDALLWQLAVLRFIDERFRASVLVTDDEVKAYYDQLAAELRKENPAASTFDALRDKIRETLEGERINRNFNEWLEQARKRYRIEYRQEALQ